MSNFFKQSAQYLDRIMKARIRIHYSWILVVVFMTAGVATQFSTDFTLVQRLTLGVIASVFFFAIVMLREFLIAITAVRRGTTARSVTVFALVSVRDIEWKVHSPALESLLGLSGVLINLLIAAVLFVANQIISGSQSMVIDVLVQWLAFITFMIALVDILPGLPLNGGRVLGAILWKATGAYERVTNILSWVGWVMGMALFVYGVVLLITTRQWFVGVLVALPGLILQNAATHCRKLVVRPVDTTESSLE